MKTRDRIRAVCATLSLAFAVPSAHAGEALWVPPTHVETPELNGVWPATGLAAGRFVFGVPEDFARFRALLAVFLPAADHVGTYTAVAQVRMAGEAADPDVTFEVDVPVSFTANQLAEVNLSALLDGELDLGSGGLDHVGVVLWVPTDLPNARLLGLRFFYERLPVFTSDLADGAVTGAKVADGSLGSADVQDGSLTGADVSDDSLTSQDIWDGPGTGLNADLLDGVHASGFAAAAHNHDNRYFTESELASPGGAGSVHWNNVTGHPASPGVDFAGGIQQVFLPNTNEVVIRSLTLTAPTSGFAVVNASAWVDFNNTAGRVRCSISTGTAIDESSLAPAEQSCQGTTSCTSSLALTRGLAVGSGATTFRLVCQRLLPLSFVAVEIRTSHLTAVFTPNRY